MARMKVGIEMIVEDLGVVELRVNLEIEIGLALGIKNE